MKTKHLLLLLISCAFISVRLKAQDISVNTQSPDATYQTDLKKSFKINFTGAKKDDNLAVLLVADDGSPTLQKGVPDGNFSIPFTFAAKKLTVKNSDKKDVTVTGNFSIKYGDKTFQVQQQAADAQVVAIDIKKPLKEYNADFTKDFKLTFKNNDKDDKMTLTLTVDKTPNTLKKGSDKTDFDVKFSSADGKVTTKDAVGKDVVISGTSFTLNYNNIAMVIKSKAKTTATPPAADADAAAKPDPIPYWSYLKDKTFEFSLKAERDFKKCPDECESCDKDIFKNTNQLIYDARSGLTYFVKENETVTGAITDVGNKIYRVKHDKKIELDAGDPLVLVIKNVNPALYDITLADSVLLTNNESTDMLNKLLFEKGETGVTIQGSGTPATKEITPEQKDYYTVRAALMVVNAEMYQTLETYRKTNLYMHTCIVDKKRTAVAKLDNALKGLIGTSYDKYKLLQMVDLFLDPATADSTLRQELRERYGEFLAADYVIAHRLGVMPEQDMLFLRLGIIAKKNAPYPNLLSTSVQRPTQTIYIKNFFKIDVSSGLYMGFNTRDETYGLADRTSAVKTTAGADSTIKRIYKENDGKNEFGFASYVHFYQKISRGFNVSATLGAGLSLTQTIRPRYFTGGSILLGSNNRFCITGGAMWGSFQQLSDQYEKTGDVYNDLKPTVTSLNYKSTFKATPFIALTYNLAFLKRKQASTATTAAKAAD
ncbi:hypothetical protein ACFGVS_00650 [Mucilaginibacter sp. AW1-7]|uniref:hypothetical protein n=1 Tax=Mucilaginibacter sp. AW1-7 TaxID=3349874 RepID=UPI003F73E095